MGADVISTTKPTEKLGAIAMIAAIERPMSFEEFVAWIPQDGRYELIDGIVFEMQPTGGHEDVTDLLSTALTLEASRLQYPYKFPRRALVKPSSRNTGFLPDVLVVDRHALATEPMWRQEATIVNGSTIKLVVEVVSTNWETDYARKLEEYESMGIQEYWIVDYLGLGGTRYIGKPKRPTFTVYTLIDGEYEPQPFREGDRIQSKTFPELNLAASNVFGAGRA